MVQMISKKCSAKSKYTRNKEGFLKRCCLKLAQLTFIPIIMMIYFSTFFVSIKVQSTKYFHDFMTLTDKYLFNKLVTVLSMT